MLPAASPRSRLFWAIALGLASFVSIASAQTAANKKAAGQNDAAAAAQKKQPRYWTTHWSFRDIDVQQLFTRLESIGVEIPIEAEGQVSVDFTLGVPWTTLRNGKNYRLVGRIQSKRLRLERLHLEDFDAAVNYSDGTLSLENVEGRWSSAMHADESIRAVADEATRGKLEGTATLQLLPRGSLVASIDTDSLPIGPLYQLVLSALQRDTHPVDGIVTGAIEIDVPLNSIGDVTAWKAKADLEVDDLRSGDSIPVSMVTGPIQMQRGVVFAEKIHVESKAKPVRIDLAAQFELAGQQRFQFHILGNDIPLESVSEWIVAGEHLAKGKLDLQLVGQGDFTSLKWDVHGSVGSPSVSVMGLELGLFEHQISFDQEHFELRPLATETEDPNVLIRHVAADYQIDDDFLKINRLSAEAFDGRLHGSGSVARSDQQDHEARLRWNHIDIGRAVGLFVPNSNRVAGESSGRIAWSAPSDSLNSPASHRLAASLQLTQLSVRNSRVGDLDFDLESETGLLRARGGGGLWGGSLSVDATQEIRADDTWATAVSRRPTGYVRAERVQLTPLVGSLGVLEDRQLRGTVTATMDLAPDQQDAGSPIRLTAFDVSLDNLPLTRQMTMRLRLRDDAVAIKQADGSFAGGRLSADGEWSLGSGHHQLMIRLAGVHSRPAFAPFLAGAKAFDGKLSGTLTLTGHDTLRVRGAVVARDTELFDVPLGTVHSGVTARVSRDLGRWNVTLRSIQGRLAGGQIQGEAAFSSSSSRPGAFDMSSQWNARRVDFGELLTAARVSSKIAHGQVTGNLSIGGRGIRRGSDLAGRFDAQLDNTQAEAIPGLVKADQFLGIISLASTRFTKGHVDGVIGAGAASINEFWLRSDNVKVWSEGKVFLANRRLDLDVVIATGNFRLGDSEFLAFAGQLALQSVLPITTLVEINRIMNNRTIHLDYYGPVTDPRIRLKPLEIIREEAARFLIRELLIAASVSDL